MKHLLSWIAVMAFVFGISSGARAQTRVTLLSPDPLKREVDEIVKNFEMKTGVKVQESYGTGVGSRKTVREGGALDVTLLFAPFDDALKTGNVDKSTQTVVARVRLAIALKEGMPSPDISNAAAVKKVLLNAKSIATVDPNQGSVGRRGHAGVREDGHHGSSEAEGQTVPNRRRAAEGRRRRTDEVAIGPYLSDYPNPNPGLHVVGALPPDAATPVDITGWISTNASDKKAAKQLLDYFKSKEAAAIWEAAKVFPVTK